MSIVTSIILIMDITRMYLVTHHIIIVAGLVMMPIRML